MSFGLFLSQKTVSLEPGFHGLASPRGGILNTTLLRNKSESRQSYDPGKFGMILSWLQALRSVLYFSILHCSYYVRTFMGAAAGVSGSPGGSVSKETACSAGDPGAVPGSGRPPGEGNGNPLQYSCLENPKDRGAWQATVHGVARVRHDLLNKPPPLTFRFIHSLLCLILLGTMLDAAVY